MAKTLRNILLVVGFLFLVHGAISAAQHRSFVRLTQQEVHSLPIDITIQTFIGFAIASWGILLAAGELKSILVNADIKKTTFDSVGNRPSYYIFDHRGKALSNNLKRDS